MMMEMKFIDYSQAGSIGHIKLNHAESCNAISLDMLREMREQVQKLDWQGEVKVLIFSGVGQGFSSGYHLDTIAQREEFTIRNDIQRNKEVLEIFRAIRNCSMVTIGQIHNYCLNGAIDLCQQFDFNIVADDAVIGSPADRRIAATFIQMWLYDAGPQWAKYMLMTGDTIDGKMAEQIGFAIKSVPTEKLEKITGFFAERLCCVDKELLAARKSMVNRGMDLAGCSQLQDIGAESICIANQSEEAVRNFRKLCVLGIDKLKKNSQAGFKPQRAPFEPMEE
jgi:enoyl-CoA hydratase